MTGRLLVAVVCLAACGPPPAAPGAAPFEEVRWRLVSLGPAAGPSVALPPGELLTLTLRREGSYAGRAGCIGFGGTYGTAGGNPTLGVVHSEGAACPAPSAAGAYLRSLSGARVVAAGPDTLTLAGPAGDRLTFVAGLDDWDARRAAGVVFHAVGQEPGWTLDIVPGQRLVLVADYGERRVVTPDPGPRSGDGWTTYEAATEAHRLRVEIVARPCFDGMSGAPYPASVTVTLDGRTYAGCGRWLDR